MIDTGMHVIEAAAFHEGSGLQVVIDRHGVIRATNAAWMRFADRFGGAAAACGPGASYYAVCEQAALRGDTTASDVLEACRATFRDGELREIRYACAPVDESPDPSSFWYRLRIARLSPELALLEHADITDEQTALQHAMRHASQAAFQRLILQAIAQPVIATDVHGTVTYWNAAAEELFGYSASEALGRVILDVTVPEASRTQAEEIMTTISRGARWTGEFCVRDRHGTRFPARVTNIPMVDKNGRIVGIVGVTDDLRPHYAREAEQQKLRELEAQLMQSQKLEALGTVAGGVAHEFNNVLAAILGNAEVLRDAHANNAEALAAADGIVEATQRARDVVYALLAFSRPQSGERTALDAEQWLKSAMRLIEPAVPPDVTLTVSFDAPPTSLQGNETQLTQVLLNLASNSAHAMRNRDRRELSIRASLDRLPSVSLATPATSDWLVVDVSDTGTGMDAALLARVFEPFFTTKPVGEGSGLGLAMVHGLVTAHGGQIAIDSTPDVGTNVCIRLPASTVYDIPARHELHPQQLALSGEILLVDDDAMVLRALTRVLTNAGLRVTGFTDPHEALRYFEGLPDAGVVSAAVIDYAMPGMRGDALAVELAAKGLCAPVLLCTGNASDIGPQRLPVRQVLEKPVSGAELVEALAAHTAHSSPGT